MTRFYSDSDDLAAATPISASTADPSYPVANIQNYLASEVWKSLGTQTIEYVAFDFSAATLQQAIRYLVIHAHNFATIGLDGLAVRFQASTTSDFAATPVDVDLSPQMNQPTILLDLGEGYVNYAYARILMTKTVAADILQIGRIYLGPGLDGGDKLNPDWGGLTHTFGEVTNTDYSVLHQKYSEQRAQFMQASFTCPKVPEAITSVLRNVIFPSVGTFQPFFMCFQPGAADAVFDFFGRTWYVNQVALPTETPISYGAEGYLTDIGMSVEEQL